MPNPKLAARRKAAGLKNCQVGTVCGRSCIPRTKNCSSTVKKSTAESLKNLVKSVKTVTSVTTGTHNDVPDYYKDKPETIKKVAEILGSDEEKATFVSKTLNSWTSHGYKDIRDTEKKGKTSPKTKAINEYIEKAPKFKGEISRGVNFRDEDTLNNFIKSAENGIELTAVSSYTSSNQIAKKFARGQSVDVGLEGKYGVIIKVANNTKGVSISPFSFYKPEEEVIVPKGTKYKLKGKPKVNNYSDIKIVTLTLEEY